MGRKQKGAWGRALDALQRVEEKAPPSVDERLAQLERRLPPKPEDAKPPPGMFPTKTVAIINTIYGLIWLAVEIIKALGSKP